MMLVSLLALTLASATVQPTGEFRGYTEVNRILKERVARANGFQLGKYLGENASEPNPNGLLALLGTYLGSDTDAAYRNGEPNSINMLLWYLALNGLASDIGGLCEVQAQSSPLRPLPEFEAALKPLCAWPQDSARTEQVLYGYWVALMSFDAPTEEYEAWKTYFLSTPEFRQASGRQAVAALTLGVLYNPYFLLRN